MIDIITDDDTTRRPLAGKGKKLYVERTAASILIYLVAIIGD